MSHLQCWGFEGSSCFRLFPAPVNIYAHILLRGVLGMLLVHQWNHVLVIAFIVINKAEHRGRELGGGLTRAGLVMVVVSNLMWLESPRRQASGHTHERINLGGQDSFLTRHIPKSVCVAVYLSVCKYPWMFQGLRRMPTVLFYHFLPCSIETVPHWTWS